MDQYNTLDYFWQPGLTLDTHTEQDFAKMQIKAPVYLEATEPNIHFPWTASCQDWDPCFCRLFSVLEPSQI